MTICTLTRNRTGHLVNQVRGLLEGTQAPVVHVVSIMGGEDPRPHLPATPWETRFVELGGTDALPLARARNAAARAANTAGLVMLDVDCIPSSTLVETYSRVLDELDGILMGEVRYLPPGGTDDVRSDDLLGQRSEPHPVRPDPPPAGTWRATDRYELLWSLSFAVRRGTLLERVGGFDEKYEGYGAEDTDLAFRARDVRVPIAWVGGACAYHQHHETYDPPVQHVRSIVGNARRFHEAWGSWPMQGWLRAFDDMGLVHWDPERDVLEHRRDATAAERAQSHRETALPTDRRS